ncbi:hypothetical protein Ddc_19145 [Ditylenchus destructor]|nr:hypothetical protein Ddc_19145 [Ditylenchus destructor]
MGVGLGVAMMMQQAAQMSGANAQKQQMDMITLQSDMRKAKAEGRTVTVINGCVYFDYQLVAQLPPNQDFPM